MHAKVTASALPSELPAPQTLRVEFTVSPGNIGVIDIVLHTEVAERYETADRDATWNASRVGD